MELKADSPVRSPVFMGALVASVAGYLYLGFVAVRENTVPLMGVYVLLFTAYLVFLKLGKKAQLFNALVGVAILCRVLFLFSEARLSDDVYRFLWDGRLSAHGINPFTYLPKELMDGSVSLSYKPSEELFSLINSPNYHTIYPPICQAIFLLAGLLFPVSIFSGVVLIRVVLILAELRTLFLMNKLLELNNRPKGLLFLYALNPLIILELTGNLHFEALMILFLMEFFYRWQTGKVYQSAFFLGLAVATKLIPLIFLPLLLRRLSLKTLSLFYAIVGSVTVVLLLPLLSASFVSGFSSSVSLYFQTFEFNASVYYVARAVGYWYKGWNTIAFNGKLMAALTFCTIMLYALLASRKERSIEQNFLFTWFLYLVFALTIHPWYVTPLIAFAPFTRFRFPIVWSFVVFFTYTGYQVGGFNERLHLIAIEYAAVYGVLLVELFWRSKGNPNLAPATYEKALSS